MQHSASATRPESRQPGPRLRAVTGNYDIDQAPFQVPPYADEFLFGWLGRVAVRYRTPPRALLEFASGDPTQLHSVSGVHRLLATEGASAARWFHLTPAELDDLCAPSPLMSAMHDHLRLFHRRAYATKLRYRFCPRCLDGPEGHWRRYWSDPLITVCETHQVLLIDSCPHCGQEQFSGPSWSGVPIPPWQCTRRRRPRVGQSHRTVRAFCAGALTDADTVQASAEEATAQRLLQNLAAHPDTLFPVAGVQAVGVVAFDALIELVDAANTGALLSAPAGSLLRAGQVLAASNLHNAAEIAYDHNLLPPHGIHAPIGPADRIKARAHSPILAAIQLTRHRDQLAPTDQLAYQMGAAVPCYPAPEPRPPRHPSASPLMAPDHRPTGPSRFTLNGRPVQRRLDTRWLPQLLWPGALPVLHTITGAADGQSLPEDVRAAGALLVAKYGSLLKWSTLARELCLPSTVVHTVTKTIRAAERADLWPQLLTEIDELSNTLHDQPPPIDYRVRRAIAADRRLLEKALTAAAEQRQTIPPTEAVIARFWELFTGGGMTYAPPWITRAEPETGDDDLTDLFLLAHAHLGTLPHVTIAGALCWQPP